MGGVEQGGTGEITQLTVEGEADKVAPQPSAPVETPANGVVEDLGGELGGQQQTGRVELTDEQREVINNADTSAQLERVDQAEAQREAAAQAEQQAANQEFEARGGAEAIQEALNRAQEAQAGGAQGDSAEQNAADAQAWANGDFARPAQ